MFDLIEFCVFLWISKFGRKLGICGILCDFVMKFWLLMYVLSVRDALVTTKTIKNSFGLIW